jgi:hypothetical protein
MRPRFLRSRALAFVLLLSAFAGAGCGSAGTGAWRVGSTAISRLAIGPR